MVMMHMVKAVNTPHFNCSNDYAEINMRPIQIKKQKKQKQQQFTTSEVAIQSKNCGLDYLTCFAHKHSITFNFILFIQHHRNNSRLRAPYTVL